VLLKGMTYSELEVCFFSFHSYNSKPNNGLLQHCCQSRIAENNGLLKFCYAIMLKFCYLKLKSKLFFIRYRLTQLILDFFTQ
jgi:hypothetical protein